MMKKVFGNGINDMPRGSCSSNGRQHEFYLTWKRMLERCYSKNLHKKRPTYKDCNVCDEWLTLSKFKLWFDENFEEGKQLDKDLLSPGNKCYSPDFCVFLSGKVNSFMIDCGSKSSGRLTGSSYESCSGKFKSSINNPITGKLENLGRFHTANDAHKAWAKRKSEIALELSWMECNQKVKVALFKMSEYYLNQYKQKING